MINHFFYAIPYRYGMLFQSELTYIFNFLIHLCSIYLVLRTLKPELHNVIFFTQIISVQLNLPQEKARKLREVFDILSIKWA